MKNLIFIFLFVIGCAKSSDNAAADKALFSSWTRNDQAISFDFTGKNFGSFITIWTFSGGAKCNSTITMSGSEASGYYSIASSTYVVGTGSGTDPGCASLNETGTYQKNGSVLNICTNGGACGVYN